MDRSLIYVSRRSTAAVNPERDVEDILAVSRRRNPGRSITGALACTRDHFAQILEGPSIKVDELMHDIELDHRHFDVEILRVGITHKGQFADWSMAYCGDSTYVARQIEVLLEEVTPLTATRVDRLSKLLVGLVAFNQLDRPRL